MNTNDSIMHYGVLGMHWGVRKNRQSVDGGRSEKINSKIKKAIDSGDARSIKKYQKYMTDSEIKTATNKLATRNNLRDQISRSKSSSGFKGALKGAATNLAAQIVVGCAVASVVGGGLALSKGESFGSGATAAAEKVLKNKVGLGKDKKKD